jgi:hypothetical protein
VTWALRPRGCSTASDPPEAIRDDARRWARRSASQRRSIPYWIAVTLAFAIAAATLLRAQLYYGEILRGWDAQFYYAMSRSLVFDRDTAISNDIRLTPWPVPFDRDRDGFFEAIPRDERGRVWTQYPIGLSLIEAPFLLLGRVLRALLAAAGARVDGPPGYSSLEIWSVALGLVLVFSLGLGALLTLLSAEYETWICLVAAGAAWLGTSLFYYSSIFPFMAHAMGFVLQVFLLQLIRPMRDAAHVNRSLALVGVILASLFLVRPQQMTVSLFVLPWIALRVRSRAVRDWIIGAGSGACFVAAGVAIQGWVNLRQFGVFTPSPYAAAGVRGFSWLAPDLFTVLLSPSRGLLWYSPVVIIAFVGLLRFRRAIPDEVWPFVCQFLLQLYVIAAWSSPAQGDSFGSRMWCENAAVVAYGVAACLRGSSQAWSRAAVFAVLACVAWTNVLLAAYMGVL